MLTTKKARTFSVAGLMFLAVAFSFGQEASSDDIGKPTYAARPFSASTQPAAAGEALPPVVTIPHWSGSFVYKSAHGDKQKFSYTMVGTSPWEGSATTAVPAAIVPISLTFSNGMTLDGGSRVEATIASPIFQPFHSQTGFTQYGDAITRASFYRAVRSTSPDWHVVLAQPAVLPVQSLVVPADAGFEFTGSHSGAPIGLVDIDWFSAQLHKLVTTLDTDPRSLTIFLTYNSFLFLGHPAKCCVAGFHSGLVVKGPDTTGINTFVWASFSDPDIFSAPLQDVTALSHEIAEWYADPFLSNVVPSWAEPGSSVCTSTMLEVADPVEVFPNLSFRVTLNGVEYHPQDAAFFSWFARQRPSIGLKGRYSYRGGKFSAPAPACQASPLAKPGPEKPY